MSLRNRVLNLYKSIIKTSENWNAIEPINTTKEKMYIRDEARTLFRQNKNVTDLVEINEHLREANARLEIAIHYNIPYPRPVNLPQSALHSKKELKVTRRMKEQSHPLYMKSYYKQEKNEENE